MMEDKDIEEFHKLLVSLLSLILNTNITRKTAHEGQGPGFTIDGGRLPSVTTILGHRKQTIFKRLDS